MDKNTKLTVAIWLMFGILFACGIAMNYKPSRRLEGGRSNRPLAGWVSSHYTSVVAGVMAYGYYVAAALLGGAEFPKFLRDHLFDGLAPAALVAILVNAYPRDDPARAFPKIQRPVTMVFLVFFIPGAVTFGLIGAAAVFSSGGNDYALPVILSAILGGYILPTAYISQVIESGDPSRGKTRWSRTMWWFKRRPRKIRPKWERSRGNPLRKLRLKRERKALEVTELSYSQAASNVDQAGTS